MIQINSEGPPNAKIMIVGEAPGHDEIALGRPFAGASGYCLDGILAAVSIDRASCWITNVCRARPPGNDIGKFIALKKKDISPDHIPLRDKMVLPIVHEGYTKLMQEIELVKPQIIIALGNTALWALTGKWGIADQRGSMLHTEGGIPVLPTYHPAAVLRQWTLRPIVIHDFQRARLALRFQGWPQPPATRFYVAPSYDIAYSILLELQHRAERGSLRIAVDIETRAGHISCIGLAWSRLDALCIPLMAVGEPEGYWLEEEEVALLQKFIPLLSHPNVLAILQNGLYDCQYFDEWLGWSPPRVHDTMIEAHAQCSTFPKALHFLASMHCEHYVYWKDEAHGWDDERTYWTYNCKDCVATWEIAEKQLAAHRGQAQDFQQALFQPVLRTMRRGVRIDPDRRKAIAKELGAAQKTILAELEEILGHPLNPRSLPQLKALFLNDLQCRPVKNRTTGSASFDDEALTTIAGRYPELGPLCERLSTFRSLSNLLSGPLASKVLDPDSRIRASFNIAGTDTYRFSSSGNGFGRGTNLQNITASLRRMIVPDPGYTFFDIDLSSADLRVVVWEADEPELKAMLQAGLDPYTEIAKEFYHDPAITKKDPRRQTFKAFAHATNYLGTPRGLAPRLGLRVADVERTQEWYFAKFPRIRQWQEKLREQIKSKRYVENAFGYRRYIFERVEGNVFNIAVAWIPQSTIACLINRAYVAIDSTLPEVQILLQVHDSLAGQLPTEQSAILLPKIINLSTIAIPYHEELVIPVGCKTSEISWGECEA